MEKRSLAIWGLRHGARHVHGFLAAGAEKIIAADIDPALHGIEKSAQVTFIRDFHDTPADVDIIVISLPQKLHREALDFALGTKASEIWIEKPVFDVGELSEIVSGDKSIQVIHELRRSTLLRGMLRHEPEIQEARLSWRRPVPPKYDPNHQPIGVVHDLGSHLVDLSYLMAGQDKTMPTIELLRVDCGEHGTQDVSFVLGFKRARVHIQVAWVKEDEWPENEIEIQACTSSKTYSLTGKKHFHRYLVHSGLPNQLQIRYEQDWYSSALDGKPTYFSDIDTALRVQKVCNEVVYRLGKELL